MVARANLWSPDKVRRTVELAPADVVLVELPERTAVIRDPDGTWRAAGVGQPVVHRDGRTAGARRPARSPATAAEPPVAGSGRVGTGRRGSGGGGRGRGAGRRPTPGRPRRRGSRRGRSSCCRSSRSRAPAGSRAAGARRAASRGCPRSSPRSGCPPARGKVAGGAPAVGRVEDLAGRARHADVVHGDGVAEGHGGAGADDEVLGRRARWAGRPPGPGPRGHRRGGCRRRRRTACRAPTRAGRPWWWPWWRWSWWRRWWWSRRCGSAPRAARPRRRRRATMRTAHRDAATPLVAGHRRPFGVQAGLVPGLLAFALRGTHRAGTLATAAAGGPIAPLRRGWPRSAATRDRGDGDGLGRLAVLGRQGVDGGEGLVAGEHRSPKVDHARVDARRRPRRWRHEQLAPAGGRRAASGSWRACPGR